MFFMYPNSPELRFSGFSSAVSVFSQAIPAPAPACVGSPGNTDMLEMHVFAAGNHENQGISMDTMNFIQYMHLLDSPHKPGRGLGSPGKIQKPPRKILEISVREHLGT